MTIQSDPFVCTLDERGAHARLPQARGLAARVRDRQRIDNRLVLDFTDDGHTRRLVDEFVRDERKCCSFFEFTVRDEDGQVVLELAAPEGAGHMLDAAMEAFDPALSDDERMALQQARAAVPACTTTTASRAATVDHSVAATPA